MRQEMKAEFLKLLTTRSTFGIMLGAVAINVAAFVAPGENIIGEFGEPLHQHQSLFLIGTLMPILLLVLGIRAITDEWRYGTMTPSLLAVPSRTRFVVAKLIAVALAGLAIAITATVAMLITAQVLASRNDLSLNLSSGDVPALLGMISAGAVWSLIGVGFGAIVKNQLLATVSGILWLMGLEDMLRGRLGDAASLLPGEAGISLGLAPSADLLVHSLWVLLIYAALFGIAGTVLLRRRDITSG